MTAVAQQTATGITSLATLADRYRYPGTLPFGDSELDRYRFFGRETESQLLLHQLLGADLLIFFGKSGLGKTSLLNARIFRLLRERDFLPLPVRFNQTDVSSTPMQVFMAAIADASKSEGIDYTPGEGASLWEFFKTAIFWRADRLETPVLILDQFEEIFTLQQEGFRRAAAAELGQLVSRRLPDPLRQKLQQGGSLPFSEKAPEVKVLISLREDGLGMLQELTPQIPSILQNRFRLTGLSPEDARQAVVEPARLASGKCALATGPFEYTEPAIDEIIGAVKTWEGAVDPFFLQLLCSHVERQVQQRQQAGEMAIRVTPDYLGGSKEKGIKAVTAKLYLDTIKRLPDAKSRKRARRLCEEGLLTAAGRRKSLTVEEIKAEFKLDNRVLDVLEQVRLLRREPKRGSFDYEISHDLLAEAIHLNRRRRLSRKAQLAIAATTLLLVGPASLMCVAWVFAYYQGTLPSTHDEARREYDQLIEGDQFFYRSDFQSALASYWTAFESAKWRAERYDNPSWQNRLALVQEKLGNLTLAQGDAVKARQYYDSSLEIVEKLAKEDPATWQRELAWTYSRIAGMLINYGHRDGLEAYRKSAELAEDLAKRYPDDLQWQREWAWSYKRLGEAQTSMEETEGALRSYQKHLEILTEHGEPRSDNPRERDQWRHDLAWSHWLIATVHFQRKDFTSALASYGTSLQMYNALLVRVPHNSEWISEVVFLHSAIGQSQSAQGDLAGAEASFDEAIEVIDPLIERDPDNVRRKTNLVQIRWVFADVLKQHRSFDKAARNYREALEILRKIDAERRLPQAQKDWIGRLESALKEVENQMASGQPATPAL